MENGKSAIPSMFSLLEKLQICVSCLLLGTIKQLHWDDLRKSRSLQELGWGFLGSQTQEDVAKCRPRSISVEFAVPTFDKSGQTVQHFSRRASQCSFHHNSPVPSSHFGSLVISPHHSSLQRTLRQDMRRISTFNRYGVSRLSLRVPGMTAARLQRTHRNSLQHAAGCISLCYGTNTNWIKLGMSHELETGESRKSRRRVMFNLLEGFPSSKRWSLHHWGNRRLEHLKCPRYCSNQGSLGACLQICSLDYRRCIKLNQTDMRRDMLELG